MTVPKILLLSLKGSNDNAAELYDSNLYEFKSRNRLWNAPNLSLLTVGALLQNEYEIEYIDLNYENLTCYSYDFVFMSPTTSQVKSSYKLAEEFKNYGVKVVMGGPHVTMLPNEAAKHADYVFIGEAEDIIKQFQKGSSETIYQSYTKPVLQNSPIPLYKLAKKYPYTSIPIQLSRGCPHQCSFCLSSTIYGKYIRKKTIKQAENELIHTKNLYKEPFIFFTDDNFLINQEYAIKVIDILENLRLKWYAFTDISVYKKSSILNRLYKSGCRKLLIGFESLNKENLNSINKSGFKSSKINEYKLAINTIQKEKIGVIGSFVLGLENDNEDTFNLLYDFILDTKMFGTNITIATPFPGTKFFYSMKEQQDITENWNLYDGFSMIYNPKNMSKDKFVNNYIYLIKKINSNERIKKVIEYFKELE